MIVAFDNTVLSLVLNPRSRPTPDPATGAPTPHVKQKIEALVDTYSKAGDQIIIPTPCLAEILVVVPDLVKALEYIESTACFEVFGFDARAAIELGKVNRQYATGKEKRQLTLDSRQKVKFDRQIVTISKVNGATILYTDDPGQTTFAESMGLKVLHTWDLGLPSEYAQKSMFDEQED